MIDIKQHITIDQFKELEVGARYKLAKELAYVPLEDIEKHGLMDGDHIEYLYNDICQNITIGKMIETLYAYDCDVIIESAGLQWYVAVAAHIDTQARELADALWLAIKTIYKYRNDRDVRTVVDLATKKLDISEKDLKK